MPRFHDLVGFILVGGESSRMGRDKALLELGGLPLVLRTARLLEPRTGPPIVIGPAARFGHLKLRVVPDDLPGCGPLAGIATALRISESSWNLIVGCDLPYLTPAWLEYLAERATASSSDVLIPRSEYGLEPLCAVYHKRCGAAVAASLTRGVRKVTQSLAELSIETIEPAEWKEFDSDGRLFKNMNSPVDYEEAQSILGKGPAP
jgi:molybdopterin-guanine dinucleotide biosynthesis protein A